MAGHTSEKRKLELSKLRAGIDKTKLGNASTRVAAIGLQDDEIARGVKLGTISPSDANDMYRRSYAQIKGIAKNVGLNLADIKMSNINSATWKEIYLSIKDKLTPGGKPKKGGFEELGL